MRSEKDFFGEKKIPNETLYGIHSIRAKENFPDNTPFPIEWYMAMAIVKKACYLTAKEFFAKAKEKFDLSKLNIKTISNEVFDAMIQSTEECERGEHYDQFIVPGISGGAGTSINMNVNEIIANLALKKIDKNAGEYNFIDPIEDANIFQSTNDVVPTSLHVAIMKLLLELEASVNASRGEIESLEKKYRNVLRLGYTQMQEAVPTTFGRLFGSYNDALSRDWWRISKCLERIKVVNLGGSAIGTSVTIPKYFVNKVVSNLQSITKLPVTRAENLSDATSNIDSLVEVHGIIKTHAVNLEKISNDIRILASDLHGRDIEIPKKQIGSSIMPGKVNPVITEFVLSSTARIYANDSLITSLSAQGCLELNAYIPAIGIAIIESLKLLIACNATLKENLFSKLTVNSKVSEDRVLNSPALTTVLLPYIGYNKAGELAKYMKEKKTDIIKANLALKIMGKDKLKEALKPEKIIQGGYILKDLK